MKKGKFVEKFGRSTKGAKAGVAKVAEKKQAPEGPSKNAEYMTRYRLGKRVGKELVAAAAKGNMRAIKQIEKHVADGHPWQPAVVAWLNSKKTS
jgi:hypothetical protein